jgi:hypothetical protein
MGPIRRAFQRDFKLAAIDRAIELKNNRAAAGEFGINEA